ncbi:hypothetical protein NIES2119_04225 [[Phormidium ambiguum] IAM M-71]|uniref:Uncharacterized protein n=1 Tax=[Phormidium ambiguum] IAM M-71 TaxID=454136 RepID=A0A1U7IRS0_9CYAN|nr:DUF6232 family protein [Phormidium ambiguum]OKH40137.1 hypothetical protein NIES2119_04225 [Phormidium ambiguum IAM M-71]
MIPFQIITYFGWELLTTHPKGNWGELKNCSQAKLFILNFTTLNSLEMVAPQETLYDRGGIRITSTVLQQGNNFYRIRDLHRFNRSEDKRVVNQVRNDLLIFGILLLIFGLLLVNPLAIIIGIIIIMIALNSSFEQVDYILTITTNKNQEIRIVRNSGEDRANLERALERAFYYSTPGREGAN